MTEVAIAAFATVLGFRMYERGLDSQRSDTLVLGALYRVLGVGLVIYGLLGGFLWVTVGVWPG